VRSIACSARAERLPERTDSIVVRMRLLHLADTLAPIDPVALPGKARRGGIPEHHRRYQSRDVSAFEPLPAKALTTPGANPQASRDISHSRSGSAALR
jgi:hypothetical protein